MARLFLNYTSCSFTEYEDGLASYSKQPTKVNYYLLRKLIKTDSELRYGRSEKVRTIYLTNPNIDVPIEIIKKVHWINIKEQWEALSQTNKDMILSIFGITDLKLYKDIDTLIVTRPLSEEGMMTEEEKITYVRAIISKYKDGRFVIKPHYVEKTDYSVYFPNIEVIKEQFPLELLFLVIGDAIKNVVTIGHCSFENFIWQHYPKINYDILDINN